MSAQPEKSRAWLPVASVLTAMVSIQTGASVAKSLFSRIGPLGATSLRLGIASIILMTCVRPWRTKLSPANQRSIALYGLGVATLNGLFYLALARIPLGIAVALEFTGPLAVAFKASKGWQDLVWVGLAVAGVVALLPTAYSGEPVDLLGVLYALGAGVGWALYIVFGQKAGKAVPGHTALALGSALAALIILPFGVLTAGMNLFTFDVLQIGLVVALLGSVLPYSLEMVALRHLSTHSFGVLMSLEPAIAAMVGFVFLKEHLSIMQWAAIGCVVVASLGSAAPRRQAKASPALPEP